MSLIPADVTHDPLRQMQSRHPEGPVLRVLTTESRLSFMRVLVTGASGQLGAYVLEQLAKTEHEVTAWSGARTVSIAGFTTSPAELTDFVAIQLRLDQLRPQAVIHLSAVSKPEDVFANPKRGWEVNVDATIQLADWAVRNHAALIFTSTDLVFDGTRGLYQENDKPTPAVEYGSTKQIAETFVLKCPQGLVARMSLMFGPSRCGRPGFFDACIAALRIGEPKAFFLDEYRTPLDYRTAAKALVALLDQGVTGIVHVGGFLRLSRFELMSRIAHGLGIEQSLIRANSLLDHRGNEPRPADVSLRTDWLVALLPELVRPTPEAAAKSWYEGGSMK